MHIVLVYRYYNDSIVYYNLTFCTRKSLMTDLGLRCRLSAKAYEKAAAGNKTFPTAAFTLLLLNPERFTFLLFYFFTFKTYCTTYFFPFTMYMPLLSPSRARSASLVVRTSVPLMVYMRTGRGVVGALTVMIDVGFW